MSIFRFSWQVAVVGIHTYMNTHTNRHKMKQYDFIRGHVFYLSITPSYTNFVKGFQFLHAVKANPVSKGNINSIKSVKIA